MEVLAEFAKILLPAGVVLYAMYLTVRSFLKKDMEMKFLDIKIKNTETVLPIRLQAYERMCLFLERISPNNLIPRLNVGTYNAIEFQHLLLKEVREEFNHNLSQQVYMSDEAWNLIKNAMEEVVVIINESAQDLTEKHKSLDLAKVIIEKMLDRNIDPITYPLSFIKDEIRQSY